MVCWLLASLLYVSSPFTATVCCPVRGIVEIWLGVLCAGQTVEVSVWCVRGDGLTGEVVTKKLLVQSVLRAWLQQVWALPASWVATSSLVFAALRVALHVCPLTAQLRVPSSNA